MAADSAGVRLSGFAAHWDKNANPAHYFDRWFLNLFPRPIRNDGVVIGDFHHHGGGYHTLNFIPALGTMIMDLSDREKDMDARLDIIERWNMLTGTVHAPCSY